MTTLLTVLAAFFLLCIPVVIAIRRRNRWQSLDRPGSDAQFAQWLNPQKAEDRDGGAT
jgi:hypothetical protein